MKSINLKEYLRKIEVPQFAVSTLSADAKLEYLNSIYVAHIQTFPYSNFELRKISRQHIVQRQPLSFFNYDALLSPEQGGYCYQTAALMADALRQIGYRTEYCAARALAGAEVNAPEVFAIPPTHMMLVVTINDKKFFLDPGLGASGPRLPILVTGKDEPVVQGCDVFKFYKSDSHNVYVLEKKTSQGWLRLIQTDLVPLSLQRAEMNLAQLQRHPQPIAIRDTKILIGIITEYGRKSLMWDEQSGQLKFSKQDRDEHTQNLLTSFTEGCEILKKEFGILISAETLKNYCTVTLLPKPLKAWTVEFPLDKTQMKKMEENLTSSLAVHDSPVFNTPETRLALKNEFLRARGEITFNIELNRFQTIINNLLNTNSITPAQWSNLQRVHNEVKRAAKVFFSQIADDFSTKKFVDSLVFAVNKAKNAPELEVVGLKSILNEFINQINILLEWIGCEKIEPYMTEAKRTVLALRPEAGSAGFLEQFKRTQNKPESVETREHDNDAANSSAPSF